MQDADWIQLKTRGDLRSICKTLGIETDAEIVSEPIECKSEDGITIGLIDAILSILKVLAIRDLSPKSVKEALLDLADDTNLQNILKSFKADV